MCRGAFLMRRRHCANHYDDMYDCQWYTEGNGVQCPGNFSCRYNMNYKHCKDRVCLNETKICDGTENCVFGEDENQCIASCPRECICFNDIMLYKCNASALPHIPREAHAMDFSNNNITIETFGDQWFFLTYLNLSLCNIANVTIFQRRNNFKILRVLDLRFNKITKISNLLLPALEELYLDENPIARIDIELKLRILSLVSTSLSYLILRKEPFLRSALSLDVSKSNLKSVTEIHTLQLKNPSTDTVDSEMLVSLNLSNNFINDLRGFCFRCNKLMRLDLSHNKISRLSVTSFAGISSLEYLSLRGNAITKVKRVYLINVCSLYELDLGQNMISVIENDAFDCIFLLAKLYLDHNRLMQVHERLFLKIDYLYLLNIAHNEITSLSFDLLLKLKNLRHLNASNNRIRLHEEQIFLHNTGIKTLDLRNNFIDVFRQIFQGLSGLQKLYVDSSTLCCARPEHISNEDCISNPSHIPSCSELIDIGVLKVLTWYMSVFCFIGNGRVLFYRFRSKKIKSSSHDVLVTQLCIADLLVGLYLLIIGFFDRYSELRYAYMDLDWRTSAICTFTGVLITSSNIASTLLVLLITLDGLLTLISRPYQKVRYSANVVLSSLIWLFAGIMAICFGIDGAYFQPICTLEQGFAFHFQ